MGRLLALVARSTANGIGVNEGTAVLYARAVPDFGGMNAKVVGASSAYFVAALGLPTCIAGSPLDGSFRVRRFRSGDVFNLADGWIDDPSAYVLTARDGQLASSLSGDPTLGTNGVY